MRHSIRDIVPYKNYQFFRLVLNNSGVVKRVFILIKRGLLLCLKKKTNSPTPRPE